MNPTIKAEKFVDSTDAKLLFFVGEASDDYGLRSLSFNYRISDEKGRQGELNTIKMKNPDARSINYEYTFDVRELALKPGDEVTYYFEVYDNDAVNGSKSARTNLMQFNMPSEEELEEKEEKNNEDIKEDLKESIKESKKIQQEMKKLREKLIQEKEVNWQTKEELGKIEWSDKKNWKKPLKKPRRSLTKTSRTKRKWQNNLMRRY